jgi:hypothetical protein
MHEHDLARWRRQLGIHDEDRRHDHLIEDEHHAATARGGPMDEAKIRAGIEAKAAKP